MFLARGVRALAIGSQASHGATEREECWRGFFNFSPSAVGCNIGRCQPQPSRKFGTRWTRQASKLWPSSLSLCSCSPINILRVAYKPLKRGAAAAVAEDDDGGEVEAGGGGEALKRMQGRTGCGCGRSRCKEWRRKPSRAWTLERMVLEDGVRATPTRSAGSPARSRRSRRGRPRPTVRVRRRCARGGESQRAAMFGLLVTMCFGARIVREEHQMLEHHDLRTCKPWSER
jgi:hypothetical protein